MSEPPAAPMLDASTLRRRPYNASEGSRARLSMMRRAFHNWLYLSILRKMAGMLRWRWLLDRPIRIRIRNGDVLQARCRDMDGPIDVFAEGAYELDFIDWSSVRTVVDAGAQVGDFAVWVCRRTPALVLAVEPNPETFPILEANIKAAGLATRVTAMPLALAAEQGLRHLSLAPLSSASSLTSHQGVEVEAETLSGVLARAGWGGADLLKVDVEGAEYEVFQAVVRPALARVRSIIVECHPTVDNGPAILAARLRSWGYTVAEEHHARQSTLVAWRD